ncbi:MAG: NAD-dependent epimerase/dehydratase family protein [Sulfurimonas sp.]|nr:NAD-dependent epimerase/dehydratase family protein [Sulfurimonas sp.]
MKVMILGGDGFCGWPTALHLSNVGMDVVIVDNLSRRMIDVELECDSLTPISPISERIATWKSYSGKTIKYYDIDIAKEYYHLSNVLREEAPDSLVHFAEQRAAPYSMKSPKHKIYTVDNNLNATHNVLCAIVENKLKTHIVHLGTMGVYGYTSHGMRIPEGYLDIKVQTDDGLVRNNSIIYPPDPGSIYHLTKTQDALMFQFYNKNDGIRITDLHQGVVWGTNTDETGMDERLINRFDYDGDYGTVLNRFLMQSVLNFPLTVYGTGGQTRAFIHIKDSVRCIELAIKNPPKAGERVKIFNQVTETHKVRDLAGIVSDLTGCPVEQIENPRVEEAENDLDVDNSNFLALGLNPTTLSKGLLEEVADVAKKYIHRCDKTKILPKSKWRT